MKKAKNNYPNRLLGSYGQPLSGSFRRRRMEQPELGENPLKQPPKFPFARIDNLLGDFSEQTGAIFG
jgi:hypothetical protein